MSTTNPPVPAEFQDLFQSVQTRLTDFGATIKAGWDGTTNPDLLMGAEALPIDIYQQLTAPGYYAASVTPFLNGLQKLGAQCLKAKVDFPMLYPPWYTAKYGAAEGAKQFQARLGVYQQFAADVRARGMKLIVQSVVAPATGGSTADPLLLSTYYPTLSDAEYTAGRVAQVIAVAELLQPDFLNFSSEPDNEGVKAMRPSLDPAQSKDWKENNVALVSAIIAGLDGEVAAGRLKGLHTTLKTAIGVSPWTSPKSDFQSLVKSYVGMEVDVIDVHSHAINLHDGNDFLDNIRVEMDEAIAAGKSVGMDEQWIYYETNAELGKLDAQTVESRNNWSFWIPLDELYMEVLTGLANWKKCAYLSFSSPNQFAAKLDFAATSTMTPAELDAAEAAAVAPVIGADELPGTPVGQAFHAFLGSGQPPHGGPVVIPS